MGLKVISESRYEVLIVGSGLSGSLLGRVLAKHGWRVLLVDRARHPRFAIGESTTPLANLALERIGRRHDLPELTRLANHGRWIESFPEIRRGLKRGFSFYLQEPGERWIASPDRRLLVAASPNDAVADTQWLRSDVDHLLARLAVEEGVELWEATELEAIEATARGLRVRLRQGAETRTVLASLIVDASGSSAAGARRLGAGDGAATRSSSSLLFGHFRGVKLLRDVIEEPASLSDSPYPEDWAAVHHLLEEGWMYLLRFDDGSVSAGLLIDEGQRAVDWSEAPEVSWFRVINRYPTLEALFARAERLRPIELERGIQRRLSRAYGPRWVAMPHTYGFVDPFFSLGIAWSLRGVERLIDLLLARGPEDGGVVSGRAFERYAGRLEGEVTQIDRLIATAYRARRRFDLFAAHAMLYFAWVSRAESFERLHRPPEPWWDGLLGAGDERLEHLLTESGRRVEAVLAGSVSAAAYARWIQEVIEPFNVAGLAEEERGNLYPVEPELLVRGAHKLDLDPSEVEAALPRLLAR